MPNIKNESTPVFVVNSAEKPTAFPTVSSITSILQSMMAYSLVCIRRGDKINLDLTNCVWSSKVLEHVAHYLIANAWSALSIRISKSVQVIADQDSVIVEFMSYLAQKESALPPRPKEASLLFELRDAAENNRPEYLDVRRYVELYYKSEGQAKEACYTHLISTLMCVIDKDAKLTVQFGGRNDQQPVSDFMQRLAVTVVATYDELLGIQHPTVKSECEADSSIVEEFDQYIKSEINRNVVLRPMVAKYLEDRAVGRLDASISQGRFGNRF